MIEKKRKIEKNHDSQKNRLSEIETLHLEFGQAEKKNVLYQPIFNSIAQHVNNPFGIIKCKQKEKRLRYSKKKLIAAMPRQITNEMN